MSFVAELAVRISENVYGKLGNNMAKELEPTSKSGELATNEGPDAGVARRIAKLIHKISSDEIEKYEQSKAFSFPFYVDETLLKKLDDCSKERLSEIPLEDDVEFSAETRFSDHSKKRVDSFKAFIDKSGDKKDPESVILSWSRFSLDSEGEPIAGAIEIAFVTEQKMEGQDDAPGDFHHSSIVITISGSNELWVEKTYNDILPYIDASKLSGIYRPLWTFRNKWFINILSQVIGFAGFFIGVNQSTKLFKEEIYFTAEQVLEKIVSTSNIGEKIDLYATQLLTPSSSPWWEPIIIIGAGGVSYAVLYSICMGLLPKLTPRSFIAIGLAGIRYRSYQNAFKFIVFSLIVSGVLLPIIMSFVK